MIYFIQLNSYPTLLDHNGFKLISVSMDIFSVIQVFLTNGEDMNINTTILMGVLSGLMVLALVKMCFSARTIN